MIKLEEEFLMLKVLTRMYYEAMLAKNPSQMLEISVDIAESADKLEQMTMDYINGHKS
jgi:hypothetical protein